MTFDALVQQIASGIVSRLAFFVGLLHYSNEKKKYLLSALLKLVISQRLLPGTDEKLVLVPEVMVVDNVISGIIRKDKLSVSEIEDAIQSNSENGSIGLINSIANLFVDEKITLEQAKAQIEEKNIEVLNRTIMQLRIKKDKKN